MKCKEDENCYASKPTSEPLVCLYLSWPLLYWCLRFYWVFFFSLSAPETSSGDRHKERRDAKEPLAKALKAASFKSENSAKIKMDHGTIGAL